MKVTFVNPYYEKYLGPIDDNTLPPLDLVNCATILEKKGFEVEVIDANILYMSAGDVSKMVSGSDIVVVATSPLNTWQCPPLEIEAFYQVVRSIKRMHSKMFVMSLGPNSIFNPQGMAEVSDLVIIGQPEPFFEQMTQNRAFGELYLLDGIAFMRKGVLKLKAPKKYYNLASLPQPNFKLLPYDKYSYAVLDSPVMLMETSRGCPERCSFCFQGMTNYAFSSKSVPQIVEELKYIRYKLGIKSVFFIDLDISIAQEKFKQWMQEIVSQGIDIGWCCQIRMSAFDNPEIIQLMSRAGCKVVMVGLESATEKAFKELTKNRTKNYVFQKVRELKKHGIRVLGFFIVGSLYEETEQDIQSTINYAKWLELDFASFQIGIPYPTTRFYSEVKHLAKGFSSEDIPLCYAEHFTIEQLIGWKKKAYFRFYLNPNYIFSHLHYLLNPKDLVRNLKLFYSLVVR